MGVVKFKKESTKVSTFTYKGKNLSLKKEKSSNGEGTVVNLYQDIGNEKRFVKTVGWLEDDGKSGCLNDKSIIRGITTDEKCKEKVITYLDGLLS